MQALKPRRACVASAAVGSEFSEVGRIAESTKGVEGNDKGTERGRTGNRERKRERGSIGARGETWNGGRKLEEKEKKVVERRSRRSRRRKRRRW